MESASRADSNPLVVGLELGNYRIKKLLGKGGMGEVYLAEDLRLKRDVALKVLPAELNQNPIYLSRFRREAQSAASLHHSNICVIHDIGEIEGRSYIAMEYIEGVSLREYLAEHTLNVEEALEIAIQIAEGLEEARKKNIVHRDIKPANIMITPSKQVKILDFGLSKQLHDADQELSNAETESRISEDGVTVGTIAYMSPEQALGKSMDLRSDIFSFGSVLYEMLAGRMAFAGDSAQQILEGVIHQDPPNVTRYNNKVPDLLQRIVNKMLAKDREERYQSIHDVWVDLRHVRNESSAQLPTTKRFLPKRSIWNVVALMIFVAVALIVILQYALKPTPEKFSSLANISSVVALPCKVYGSKEMNYLTDAVPSTLSTYLTKVSGLETKMPASTFEIEKLKGDLGKIEELYNVHAFVVSSVSAQPTRFVLNIQLVDARNRRMLWSNQYEGRPEDYIDFTREAADGIREAIQPESNALTSIDGMARNSKAELAFREGQYFSNRFNNLHNIDDFKAAEKKFTEALQLDPKLADAAAEIGWLYSFLAESGMPAEDAPEKMVAWGQQALEINPRCSKAWTIVSSSEFYRPQINKRRFLEGCLKAAFFNERDSYAHNIISNALYSESLILSTEAAKQSTYLDPVYVYPPTNVGCNLIALGKSKEALPWLDRALAIEPHMFYGSWYKIFALAELNRLEESKNTFKRLAAENTQKQLPDIYILAAESVVSGGDEKILQKYLEALRAREVPAVYIAGVAPLSAPYILRTGKRDQALVILEQCDKAEVLPYDFLILNPAFKALADEPRFQKVVARAHKRFDEMVELLKEAQSRGEFPVYLRNPLEKLLKQLLHENY
jgi:eukaryotic-like serine/threonine-protein kinase